jgi:hypothetical protein
MTVPVSDLVFLPLGARLLWGSRHVSHTVFLSLLCWACWAIPPLQTAPSLSSISCRFPPHHDCVRSAPSLRVIGGCMFLLPLQKGTLEMSTIASNHHTRTKMRWLVAARRPFLKTPPIHHPLPLCSPPSSRRAPRLERETRRWGSCRSATTQRASECCLPRGSRAIVPLAAY